MFEVIEKERLVPNLYLLTIRAPEIVETIQPGQFVILRSDNDAERIPLSVADWNKKDGTLSMIFMVCLKPLSKQSCLS